MSSLPRGLFARVGGGGWGLGESRSTLSRAEDCSRRSTSPASPANGSIPIDSPLSSPFLPLSLSPVFLLFLHPFPDARNDSSTRETSCQRFCFFFHAYCLRRFCPSHVSTRVLHRLIQILLTTWPLWCVAFTRNAGIIISPSKLILYFSSSFLYVICGNNSFSQVK